MPTREGTFYPIWPVLDGKALNLQWGQIRSNQAELKAIARNSVQELGSGDELNALRSLLGQAYGDLTFRNKFRLFYNKATKEICCQKNDGTVATPVWTDAWCVRHHDGQFQVVSTGGISSTAGFYSDDDSLKSMKEIGETGTAADTTVLNPVRLFFNADDGFGVTPIASGANRGAPEITFTQPFGRAEVFSKAGKEWTVAHSFGITPVMAQVMDADDRIVIPDKADVSDPNTAYFYFNEPFTGSVYIASGGLGAASLLPRDPFYLSIRTHRDPSSPNNTLRPNADLVFDAEHFYVNVDLDAGAGGAHKKAIISLTDNIGSPFKKHVQMDDTLHVANTVTAEAFYLQQGSGGEIYKGGPSGKDLVIKSRDGQVVVDDEMSVTGKVVAESFYTAAGDIIENVTQSSHLLLSNIGANTHPQIDTHINDGTIHFTEGSIDHGSVGGLTDDDHAHYSRADGTRAFTGNVDLGGNDLTGIGLITGDNRITGSLTAEAFYTKDGGEVTGSIIVKEADGSPNVSGVTTIVVQDGTLTDDGSGQVTLAGGSNPRFNTVTSEGFYVQGGGELDATGLEVADGTAAAPSLSFVSDDDTGLYRSAPNKLAVSVGGNKEAEFDGHGLQVENRIIADAFYFTSGGEITIHRQLPQFSGAGMINADVQTVSASSNVTLEWGTPIYDAGGWIVSAGDDFFTVPTGVSFVKVALQLACDSDADGRREVSFQIDHGAGLVTPVIRATNRQDALGSTGQIFHCEVTLPVVTGDKIYGIFFHDAGNDLDTKASALTWMTIEALAVAASTNFNNITAEGFYVQGGGELGPLGLEVADGTAAAPSISFVTDDDTGIYRPAANEVAVSVGGAQVISFRPESVRVAGVVEAQAFYLTTGGEAPQSYVENFAAAVEWEVGHNLARTSFICQAYKSNGKLVIPDEIDVSNPNTTFFYFAIAQEGKAVILGIA